MILISQTYWGGAPFRFQRPPRGASVDSRVLRTADFRDVRALYWTPVGQPRPRTAVVALHPRVDFTHHYAFPRLLQAGIGCLGAISRCAGDDTHVVHEELVLDLGACVQWLREHRGVERLVLLGNSGGGSLAAMYLAQAGRAPEARLRETPAGDPVPLGRAALPPADGLVLLAAHRGQARVMEGCIDPAVVDEDDPLPSDPALDMYDPANGFRTPPQWTTYDPAFIERFRAGQQARLARLDARALAHVERRRQAAESLEGASSGDLRLERLRAWQPVMVVYRTMANPHYVDRSLDPSARSYGSLLSERPDLMNLQRLGFARTCSPEAWLSTWSPTHSNADLVRNLAEIDLPVLLISAGADREIYPRTDVEPVWQALAHLGDDRRTRLDIDDARHYFEPDLGQPTCPARETMLDHLVDWITSL